jgi:phosphoribosyl-AMP cyclohydrolase
VSLPAQTEPFLPRFDAAGLVTAVVQDQATGEVLMVAHMDAEALARTRETGLAHFHSRSRGRLWMKGETSGNTLRVRELRVDCDQDAVLLRVEPSGPACHTGARSCFYRVVDRNRGLRVEP